MGYMHINNLYKEQDILMLKECYAMEKIHGTSAHIGFNSRVYLHSGGCSMDEFTKLFDINALHEQFMSMWEGYPIMLYGEAYGGKQQGMKETYGPDLKWVGFEVKIGDYWLDVPKAEKIIESFGLEFVEYLRLTTNLRTLELYKNAESGQAIRNGMGLHRREGIVLRPVQELTKNNGQRIIAKWKNPEFSENKKERPIQLGKVEMVANAEAIAEDWVTHTRLIHVLDAMLEDDTPVTMEDTSNVIRAMIADIRREGEGEIEWTTATGKYIGKRTAKILHAYIDKPLAGR